MIKHFLFLADKRIDRPYLINALKNQGVDGELTFLSDKEGVLLAEGKLAPRIEKVLPNLYDDLSLSLVFLSCHEDSQYTRRELHQALSYFPNRLIYLSDLIMKEMSFGNYSSLQYLSSLFKGVHPELLLTAGAYLRSGLDAFKAAESLYVHRNTFNYRINKFIKVTGLDIRDYHNALLLELYFQFGVRQ